jgi:Na+-transporting methylmalonyl-CoA/oxaloacetate decarboxylase gamma subunit
LIAVVGGGAGLIVLFLIIFICNVYGATLPNETDSKEVKEEKEKKNKEYNWYCTSCSFIIMVLIIGSFIIGVYNYYDKKKSGSTSSSTLPSSTDISSA